MKIEDAEYIINMNPWQCSGCPMYTPMTGHCVSQSCADAVQEAAVLVVSARDASIADLEKELKLSKLESDTFSELANKRAKERDEAREDAFNTADKLAQLALGIKNGTVKQSQVSDAYQSGISIMEKYK